MPLSPKASDAESIFVETVELKHIHVDEEDEDEQVSPRLKRHSSRQFNAFDLIGTALDLSTLFEHRKDMVQR